MIKVLAGPWSLRSHQLELSVLELSPSSWQSLVLGQLTSLLHGFLPVCMSVSRLSPFYTDISQIGVEAYPTPI